MEPNIDRSMWGIGVLIIAVVVGVLAKDKIYAAVDGIFNKMGTAIGGVNLGGLGGSDAGGVGDGNSETISKSTYISYTTTNSSGTTLNREGIDELLSRLANEEGVSPTDIELTIGGQVYKSETMQLANGTEGLTETHVDYSYKLPGGIVKSGKLTLTEISTAEVLDNSEPYAFYPTTLRRGSVHKHLELQTIARNVNIVNTAAEGKALIDNYKQELSQFGFVGEDGEVIETFTVKALGEEIFDMPNVVGTVGIRFEMIGEAPDGKQRKLIETLYMVKDLPGTDLALSSTYKGFTTMNQSKTVVDIETLQQYMDGDGYLPGEYFKTIAVFGSYQPFDKNTTGNVINNRMTSYRAFTNAFTPDRFKIKSALNPNEGKTASNRLTTTPSIQEIDHTEKSSFFEPFAGGSGGQQTMGQQTILFEIHLNGVEYNYAEYIDFNTHEGNTYRYSDTVNRFFTVRSSYSNPNKNGDYYLDDNEFKEARIRTWMNTYRFYIFDSLTGTYKSINELVSGYDILDLDPTSDALGLQNPKSSSEKVFVIKFNDSQLIDASQRTKAGNTDHYIPVYVFQILPYEGSLWNH